MNDFSAWTAIGAFLGVIFGPLRLAGVDFGKWYRDPGEVSEGNDRSWIGLFKWTALSAGRWLAVVLPVGGAAAAILSRAPASDPPELASLRGSPWAIPIALAGLAAGVVIAQPRSR